MMWLCRIAAAPLLLLAFIGAVGLIKSVTHRIDDLVGTAVSCTILVLLTVFGAFFLVRPDIERLRGLSFPQLRHWVYANPLAQAIALYAVAALLMAAYPDGDIIPGVMTTCVYSIAAPWSAALQQRGWAYGGLALLGFSLLFLLLAGTAEALASRGFGEVGMLYSAIGRLSRSAHRLGDRAPGPRRTTGRKHAPHFPVSRSRDSGGDEFTSQRRNSHHE